MVYNDTSSLSSLTLSQYTDEETLPSESIPSVDYFKYANGTLSFYSLLRHLDQHTVDTLERLCRRISSLFMVIVKSQVNNLGEFWNSPILSHECSLIILLNAVRKEIISPQQFMTLENLSEAHQAQRRSGLKTCYHIFHDKEALQILTNSFNRPIKKSDSHISFSDKNQMIAHFAKGSLGLSGSHFNAEIKRLFPVITKTKLTKKQESIFLKILQTLPSTEHYFFVFPRHIQCTPPLIRDQIGHKKVGISAFNVDDYGNPLVVSIGMMEAYLKAKFSHHSSTPIFTVGSSSIKEIRDGLLSKSRALSVMPKILGLNNVNADNLSAPGGDFVLHDFYHHFHLSCIEQRHLDIYYNLVTLLREEASRESCPEVKSLLYSMSWLITDTEFIGYEEMTRKTLFKFCFPQNQDAFLILVTMERIFRKMIRKIAKNYKEDELEVRNKFLNSQGFQKLIHYLFQIDGLKEGFSQALEQVFYNASLRITCRHEFLETPLTIEEISSENIIAELENELLENTKDSFIYFIHTSTNITLDS